MKRATLLLAGMHRSGTSVAAQWLYRCGLPMGHRFVAAGIGNEEGHFEDADFLELHEKILRSKKLPHTGFVTAPLSALLEADTAAMRALVTQKNLQLQWGWKEPRTCLFLDTYSNLLPDAVYLVLVRNFNDTVHSLVTREYKFQEDFISQKKGWSWLKWKLLRRKSLKQLLHEQAEIFLQVWILYNSLLLLQLAQLPPQRVLVCSTRTLLQDDSTAFLKLTQEWGLQLHPVQFKEIYKQHLQTAAQDIAPFIKNKSVLVQAGMLQDEFIRNYGVQL